MIGKKLHLRIYADLGKQSCRLFLCAATMNLAKQENNLHSGVYCRYSFDSHCKRDCIIRDYREKPEQGIVSNPRLPHGKRKFYH